MGLSLGPTDGETIGTEEGIILSSSDGEVLGTTLWAADGITLGLFSFRFSTASKITLISFCFSFISCA